MTAVEGWTPGADSDALKSYRVARTTTADDLTTRIRELIMTGVLRPGQALPQPQLAAELGVSRTPLREAFQRLAGEGLLQLDPRKGAVVALLSREDFLELYELRQLLEGYLIRDVAKHFSEADFHRLWSLAEQCSDCTDDIEWVRHNRTFHTAVYQVARKSQAVEVATNLASRADVYVRVFAGTAASRSSADEDHFALLRALRDGNVEAAVSHTVRHLQNTLARTLTAI